MLSYALLSFNSFFHIYLNFAKQPDERWLREHTWISIEAFLADASWAKPSIRSRPCCNQNEPQSFSQPSNSIMNVSIENVELPTEENNVRNFWRTSGSSTTNPRRHIFFNFKKIAVRNDWGYLQTPWPVVSGMSVFHLQLINMETYSTRDRNQVPSLDICSLKNVKKIRWTVAVKPSDLANMFISNWLWRGASSHVIDDPAMPWPLHPVMNTHRLEITCTKISIQYLPR